MSKKKKRGNEKKKISLALLLTVPPPDQPSPAIIPQPRRLGVVLVPQRLGQRQLHLGDGVAGGQGVQPPLGLGGSGVLLGIDGEGERVRGVLGELGGLVARGEVGLPGLPGGPEVVGR